MPRARTWFAIAAALAGAIAVAYRLGTRTRVDSDTDLDQLDESDNGDYNSLDEGETDW